MHDSTPGLRHGIEIRSLAKDALFDAQEGGKAGQIVLLPLQVWVPLSQTLDSPLLLSSLHSSLPLFQMR